MLGNQHVKKHLHIKNEAVAGLTATPKMFYIKRKRWVRFLQHSQTFDIEHDYRLAATCKNRLTKKPESS